MKIFNLFKKLKKKLINKKINNNNIEEYINNWDYVSNNNIEEYIDNWNYEVYF